MRLQKRKGTVDGYEWRCRNQPKDNRHDVVRSISSLRNAHFIPLLPPTDACASQEFFVIDTFLKNFNLALFGETFLAPKTAVGPPRILPNFLISKVDACISQRWELSLENNKIPTLEEFRVFIEREARGLNELKFVKPDIKKSNVKPLNSFNKSNVNTTVLKCNQVKSGVKPDVVKGNNCILCYQSHALFKCPTFNSMNVNERWQVVQNNNLCTNCLRSNHRLDTCRIGFSCKNCSERHHTLLHIYSFSPSADTQANSVVTVSNNYTQSAEGHVLLSTALINVKSKHGEQITCHALIDNASQNSLISKQCADRLKLPLKHTNHKLVGVNETFAETSLYSTNFEFSSCVSSDKFQVKALLVSKVTSAMPNFPIKYHE
ncbi:DUF1758 domain-containing protein [Trichonephila clavipes]|nr:DUF1758 domain-containing protein [Trichonephila clavipes]